MARQPSLPETTKDLIKLTLHHYGLRSIVDNDTALAYRMTFEGGIEFAAIFRCIAQRRLLLFYEEALSFVIADIDEAMNVRRIHFEILLRMPTHAHDMEFSMALQAGFAQRTRAVANALGGGQLLGGGDGEHVKAVPFEAYRAEYFERVKQLDPAGVQGGMHLVEFTDDEYVRRAHRDGVSSRELAASFVNEGMKQFLLNSFLDISADDVDDADAREFLKKIQNTGGKPKAT